MDKYKEFYEEVCKIIDEEEYPEYVDERVRNLIINFERIATLERSKDGMRYYCSYCGASLCAEYKTRKRCVFCESIING